MESTAGSSSKSKRPTTLQSTESPENSIASEDKRLKKDDSGINMSDEEKNVTEIPKANDVQSVPNSPDSGNLESSSSNDLANLVAQSANERLMKKEIGSDIAISDEDSNIGLRCHTDFDDSQYDPTPVTPKPKHNWVAPKAIWDRQLGFKNNYSPALFRYECYGSLHMVERLELMYKMNKHEGCVNALNFNNSGTQLLTASDDLYIVLWDWAVAEPIAQYHSGHKSNVFQAKFMPLNNDSKVVSCARDGQVRLGDISTSGTWKDTRKIAQHKGAAHKLAIQADSGHTFLSCGEDAAVFEIDLRNERPEKLVICKENARKVPLYSIFINPRKSYEYVVGGKDQYVRVYDNRYVNEADGFLKKFCPEHLVDSENKAYVSSVVYNYNGQEILASYNDEDIYNFDAQTQSVVCNQYLHRYRGHRNGQTVKGVNYFGSKSEYVLSGSDCGHIFFWDKESEHIVKFMYGK